MKNDIIVTKFDSKLIKRNTKMPIICVFCNPTDYMGKYVARLFDINKPTKYIAIADSLEEIRKTIPEYMTMLNREAEDKPQIVESWL